MGGVNSRIRDARQNEDYNYVSQTANELNEWIDGGREGVSYKEVTNFLGIRDFVPYKHSTANRDYWVLANSSTNAGIMFMHRGDIVYICEFVDDVYRLPSAMVGDSRRIKDGIGTNAMNLNGYKVYIKDMDTYTNKISDEELQSLFDFPSSKEFQLKDFLNGVADVAESLGDLIVLKYSRTTNWYFIELDSKSMDATISFTVEKIESSPNFLYDIEEYFNDKSVEVIIDK